MTALSRSLRRRREIRARLRAERAVQQALAAAPTVESAHEIAAAAARR